MANKQAKADQRRNQIGIRVSDKELEVLERLAKKQKTSVTSLSRGLMLWGMLLSGETEAAMMGVYELRRVLGEDVENLVELARKKVLTF